MAEHRARRRFGQNFLQDPAIIAEIIALIAPQPGQHVVEIGPGLGALTTPLLHSNCDLDVVELDRDLAAGLAQRIGADQRLQIHQQDALRFDFCSLARADKRLRIVGNLPYNISSPLLFALFAQAHCIDDMYFMLQHEVVERLTASPGSKAYGRLSVMAALYCRCDYLLHVPPQAFQPVPKVDSAIVRLLPHRTPPVATDPQRIARVVAAAFSQRRKTLRNSLRQLLTAESIEACGIDPSLRAEVLSLADFSSLAEALADVG